MFLVTGATGHAGSAVVRALLDRGAAVRALVRDPSRTTALPDGAEPAVGDLNDPAALRAAADGAEAAFLLAGYDGLPEALAGLRDAGVGGIVLLSSSAAPTGDLSNAVARYHIESERQVRESGLPFTFLQPNSFMTNTLRWAPQLADGDVVRLPFGDVAIATIDPADIGAVAALALTGDGHAGRTYRLSGPEALTPGEQVATVGDVLGRNLRFDAMTEEEARAEYHATMPPEYADAFLAFFADGAIDETTVQPTVREVLGRDAGTYRAWVEANAGRLAAV